MINDRNIIISKRLVQRTNNSLPFGYFSNEGYEEEGTGEGEWYMAVDEMLDGPDNPPLFSQFSQFSQSSSPPFLLRIGATNNMYSVCFRYSWIGCLSRKLCQLQCGPSVTIRSSPSFPQNCFVGAPVRYVWEIFGLWIERYKPLYIKLTNFDIFPERPLKTADIQGGN